MPVRPIPGSDLAYHLVAFDEDGRERRESGELLSDEVHRRLVDRHAPVTDVFLTSHGWKSDVAAAIEQYDRWVVTMVAQGDDRTAARARPQGFRPLVVGLHWPSQPWGDEELPGPGGLLGDGADPASQVVDADVVDTYAARIADTPRARAALATIVAAARHASENPALTPELRAAYAVLYAESGLGHDGAVGAPGADQDGFDPVLIIDEAGKVAEQSAASSAPGVLGETFGARVRDLLLTPVRQLSFWAMKDRARRFGEGGAHSLLWSLQAAAPEARFHLMGHSFGCIVMSGAVAGPATATDEPRPVASLFLVQGALSLWSACPNVPFAPGVPGYYSRLLADGLVRGPVATTRSAHDSAVGVFYPLGARLRAQYLLDQPSLPQYGGVGTFGLQGLGPTARDLPIGSADYHYDFRPQQVYNLEATAVIARGDGLSGAHSDIAHPEVAHVQWQLALAAP